MNLSHAHLRQMMRPVFLTRFLYAFLLLGYLGLAGGVAQGMLSMSGIMCVWALYTFGTLVLFAKVMRSGMNPTRIYTGIALDLMMIGVTFSHDPYVSCPSIVCSTIVLYGNGLRHGMHYYMTALLALVAVIIVSVAVRVLWSHTGFALEAIFTTLFTLISSIYGYQLLTRFLAQREVLQNQSHYDDLTGLLSRRAIEQTAQEWLQHCRHQEQNCLLLYMDLDNFKKINDRYGHAQGDSALQVIADELQRSLPACAICGRHGGDEFFAILPDSDKSVAEDICALLESRIREIGLRWPGVDLGISVGYAQSPSEGVHFDDLLEHADRNMYERKNKRRQGQNPPIPRMRNRFKSKLLRR